MFEKKKDNWHGIKTHGRPALDKQDSRFSLVSSQPNLKKVRSGDVMGCSLYYYKEKVINPNGRHRQYDREILAWVRHTHNLISPSHDAVMTFDYAKWCEDIYRRSQFEDLLSRAAAIREQSRPWSELLAWTWYDRSSNPKIRRFLRHHRYLSIYHQGRIQLGTRIQQRNVLRIVSFGFDGNCLYCRQGFDYQGIERQSTSLLN